MFSSKSHVYSPINPNIKQYVKVSQLCPTLGNPMDYIACQTPLSMECSRPEYRSEQLFPSPGGLSNPGMELRSPELQVDSLPSEPPGKHGFNIKTLNSSEIYFYFQTNKFKQNILERSYMYFGIHVPPKTIKGLRSSNVGSLAVRELALFFEHARYFQSLLDNSRNKSQKTKQSVIFYILNMVLLK